jgi:predicted transcriptional regulator YheO
VAGEQNTSLNCKGSAYILKNIASDKRGMVCLNLAVGSFAEIEKYTTDFLHSS